MKKALLVLALSFPLILSNPVHAFNQDTKPSIAWSDMYKGCTCKGKVPEEVAKEDRKGYSEFESWDNAGFKQYLESNKDKEWDGDFHETIYPNFLDSFKVTAYTLGKKELKAKDDWKFKYFVMPEFVEFNGTTYRVSDKMFPKKYAKSKKKSAQYKKTGLFYHVNSRADMEDFVARAIKWHKKHKTKGFPKAYDDQVMYVLFKDGEGLPLLPRTIANNNLLMNTGKMTAHGMYNALKDGLVWSPEFKTFVFVEELCDKNISNIYKHYLK